MRAMRQGSAAAFHVQGRVDIAPRGVPNPREELLRLRDQLSSAWRTIRMQNVELARLKRIEGLRLFCRHSCITIGCRVLLQSHGLKTEKTPPQSRSKWDAFLPIAETRAVVSPRGTGKNTINRAKSEAQKRPCWRLRHHHCWILLVLGVRLANFVVLGDQPRNDRHEA